MTRRTGGTEWLWAALVIAVALGMAAWDAVRDYGEAIDQAYERISALTRVVEARTHQTFTAIDQLLRDSADELGEVDAPGDPLIHRFLIARSRIRSEALTVTIVGSDGVIRHSTAGQLVGKNVGNRSYLAHFLAQPGDDGLFIGEPVAALLNRKVVFAARGVRHPDGTLRAVAVSALAPEIFDSLLESAIPTEESGAISLSNRDHLILARAPNAGNAIGQSLADAPLMKAHLADGGTESRLEGIGGVDGVKRLIAIRTVMPYGITVGVSVGKAELFMPVLRGMAGSATFLSAVIVVTVILLRHGRTRERARVEAEQRVIRARDHYVRILDGFPALIRRTDPTGRCDYVNRTWLDFTGRALCEEVGDGWVARIHPDDRATLAETNAECEFRLLRGDGSFRWLHEIRRPFTDVDGAAAGTLAACVDVTDAKLFQQQLQRSNEELEQFAYVASHDLREPLRMISSYITLIERRLEPEPGSDIADFLAFARDGATRMDRLVLDLLQFSRIGRLSAPRAPVDATTALTTAMAQLRFAIEDSKTEIHIGPLPTVLACEDDLVRLFQNLLGNALKYATPGQLPHIAVSAEPAGTFWQFSVADNGIGIAPQYHERVFRIFQRLHRREAHGGGSGIGLAVCKKIVESHGGRIWVASPGEGAGTTFQFTLPALPNMG
jgi:PAS domain S-box-containing protein